MQALQPFTSERGFKLRQSAKISSLMTLSATKAAARPTQVFLKAPPILFEWTRSSHPVDRSVSILFPERATMTKSFDLQLIDRILSQISPTIFLSCLKIQILSSKTTSSEEKCRPIPDTKATCCMRKESAHLSCLKLSRKKQPAIQLITYLWCLRKSTPSICLTPINRFKVMASTSQE